MIFKALLVRHVLRILKAEENGQAPGRGEFASPLVVCCALWNSVLVQEKITRTKMGFTSIPVSGSRNQAIKW